MIILLRQALAAPYFLNFWDRIWALRNRASGCSYGSRTKHPLDRLFKCLFEFIFSFQYPDFIHLTGKLILQGVAPATTVIDENEEISDSTGGVHGGEREKKAAEHNKDKG
ncbi:hypothetical protein GMJAKD_04625 [Candidatus Electrothrix aarhusensis]